LANIKTVISGEKAAMSTISTVALGETGVLRRSGLETVGDVPWGTHFCQFYETADDLIDILVPYFKAGLGNNEFCMWVTSESLSREEAENAMRKAVPDFAKFLKRGQMEIVSYGEWYLKDGAFDLHRVLDAWMGKLNEALAKGYDGIRVTGNTAWLEKKDWKDFVDYEEKVNGVIGKYRMIVVCTYSISKCGAAEVIDVIRNHQFALIRREGKWELVESSEIKQTKEALLAERDRLETVTRNIGAGLAIISKDYRTLWANDVLKQIFGDVEGKICYSTYNQRNSICPECGVHEIFEAGKAKVVHEQVGNDVDGKTIWSEITATPIKDKDGNITSVLELVVRMTERKQLEESIKESEERLKNIFAASPDAITVSDSNGNIIECNQATLDMLGFSSKEELIGKNGYELIAKKDHQKATKNLKETLDQGSVRNIEYTFLTRDGHEFPTELSASVLKDSSGKVVGFVSVAKNISERKKAEEELRKFKTISDKAGYGSAISDLEGNLIYVNESLAKMHGFTADELIGKNLSIFHTKVQMKNVARSKEQLRQKGSYVSEEVWHKRRDNTVFPTLMNGTLIRDEKGKPLFMAATAADITERKRMEDELKRYSEHLEELVEQRTRKLKEAHEQLLKTERLAAIGELATMVAHDLRNPLTSIRNAGFYIKNSCPARATGECKTALEMLDIIDQEIIFTNNIINHLLDFAAKRPLQKKKQNINSLIDDSLKRIHIPQNINVERKYTKKATAAVDEKQLERVFINLTRNAVQAMPNGGILTITTNETKDHIEIAFTDTGTGIQKENMNKLFSPLFTTKAKGIGIGLAICKKIVEQHGGTIEARSKAGQGTTFTIKLLKKEEANAQ
jgi:PAS domain S-box-containing protein